MEYSGRTTAYEHKHDIFNPENKPWSEIPHDGKPALGSVVFFDVQWSDCPVEVESEVRNIWIEWELGNDCYIAKTTIEELLDCEYLKTDYIIDYLRSHGIADNQTVAIHWWW